MTIILGKEGQQPFNIFQTGVSRQHAKVTIDEQNQWFIEDLGSANGTFVRRESDGTLVRVGKLQITPLSYICLGPDNAHGCRFYARQVLPDNAGRFNDEFVYMNEKMDIYEEKIKKVERTHKFFKYVIFFVNILVIIVSIAGPKIILKTDDNGIPVPLIDSETNFWLLRICCFTSIAIYTFFDPQKLYKRIEQQRRKYSQCPNPDCGHVLSSFDVREYQCPRCKNIMRKKIQ